MRPQCYHCITTLAFYNYPTTVLLDTLYIYGDYKAVIPFDPPTHNTIKLYYCLCSSSCMNIAIVIR